jgi:hypothetical protein
MIAFAGGLNNLLFIFLRCTVNVTAFPTIAFAGGLNNLLFIVLGAL